MNSSISSSIGAVSQPVQDIRTGSSTKRDPAMWPAVLTVPNGDENRADAVQDQCRRADAPERLSHVAVGDNLGHGAGHARRPRTVAGQIPPRAKSIIVGNTRRDHPQNVETLVHSVGLERDGREWISATRLCADRVVGRP
jgi:hypothetical protein